MKKILTFLVVICILMTGTISYAAKSPILKAVSFKELREELQPKLDTIISNNTSIAQLQKDLNSLYKETKLKIKALTKSKEKITQVQIEALKSALSQMNEDEKTLANTKGDLLKQTKRMNTARVQRNGVAFRAAVNRILEIQDIRINTFNKIISDLEELQDL